MTPQPTPDPEGAGVVSLAVPEPHGAEMIHFRSIQTKISTERSAELNTSVDRLRILIGGFKLD